MRSMAVVVVVSTAATDVAVAAAAGTLKFILHVVRTSEHARVSPLSLISLRAIMIATSFCLLFDARLVFACFQGGNNISMLPSVKWKN